MTNRTYSNPEVQKAMDNINSTIIPAFDRIIADMKYTTQFLGRRESDKSRTSLTAEQAARMEANKGKHIYGTSHPLYVKES